MTDIIIDGGTLTASRQDRVVRGLLLPYREECRSNIGRFSFAPGVVEIPQDLTGMSLNIEHERERVVGAVTELRETPAGILATFSIAKTPAGDAALSDIEAGRRVHLSAEVAGVKVKDGKGIAGSLFAAGLVEKPAFPSATLLAAEDTSDDEDDPQGGDDTETTHSESEYVDEDGNVWRMVVDTETETDGDTTTTTTTVVEEVTENPDETTDTEEEEDPMPATLAAKAKTPTPPRGRTRQRPSIADDLPTLYATVAQARAGDQQALTLLAALTDTKISGTGALPGAGVLQESWQGQLWQGKSYDRKYINQGTLGTNISAAGKSGFKMARGTKASPKTKLGGDWAGNKTELPTGTANAEKFGSTLARWAFAGDIAREFFDLPGGAELIEAMFRLIAEDYAIWSDEKALATFLKLAGAPVAPKTYPSEYNDSLGMLLQGILAVKRAKDEPSFAIVNSTAYEQLLYTPHEKVPEFVSFDITTELRGTADAGKVYVVEAADSYFVDADDDPLVDEGEPAVLVGAKAGVEFDELGEVPFTIDALEIAKGGVDRATHGYLQTFEIRPESFVLIGSAPVVGG
ncbi:hypothetical protein ACFPZL_01135 [Leucobacter soli]|uniref:Uncharacterized protein n=1 Tax=Leucobacter soli TaxID=2812850 RepID=A0A916NI43_9MICO|nr:hypothetical protein [Leucobacter soli]CAG7618405.1 hypothetical protein LEUCIP111803_02201 [Leucobacter soli]